MSSNLYLTAKYDLMCLFTSISIKIHFPLVSPCINVMYIIIDLVWLRAVEKNDVSSVNNFRLEVRLSGKSLI